MKRKKIYAFITEETTRRKAIEADLNVRLRQQEAIAWFGEYAIGCLNLDDLLAECARLATETLQVDLCKILELQTNGKNLLLKAGVGWRDGLVGNEIVGAGTRSQSGYTLLTEEPVIADDLRVEKRFSVPKLLVDHQVFSGMTVTILGKEKPFGVIGVFTLTPRTFTAHDARFLKAIANIVGSAIDRFRAENELRQSRDELAIILNGVSEGITVQDPDGHLVFANQTAAELLGYQSVDELLYTPLTEVMSKFAIFDETGASFNPEKLPGRQVLNGQDKASARIRFRILATGEDHWSIADAMPVRDPAGNVLQSVNIFRDISEMVRQEQWQNLLAEAGSLFSDSLDYETTLSNLANLIVKKLADWCTVHLVDPHGEIYQLAVAHRDPAKGEIAREFERRYPPSWTSSPRLAQILSTGETEYYPDITDEMLSANARDSHHFEMMRTLGLRSAMLVPLVARNRSLGVITLIWAESGSHYNQEEVEIVQELARRAAIALDNARLYQESQALNAELEQRVALRTEQLQVQHNRLLSEIEERIRVEDDLRNSETMLQSLFESAPDATILVSTEGKIVRANAQVVTLFGYERAELIDQSVDMLLPDRYRTRHGRHRHAFWNRASARPMGAGMDLYALRKDGTEFPVDVMLSPIKTKDGDLVISSIRDMTEAKRLQAELAETHRRLFESIEAERLLLSQELHDGPIQDLYAMSFQIELMKAQLDQPEMLNVIAENQETIQGVIQVLRGICTDLRPPVLSNLGLEKAIRSHAAKVTERHPDLVTELNLMSDQQKLPERVRLALYRVYQNSINNIVRHAEATWAKVTLQVNDDRAVLEVEDNGCGFTLPDKWIDLVRTGHFGLAGMVERVEGVGGYLSIHSVLGEGTRIQVEVPLNNNIEERK